MDFHKRNKRLLIGDTQVHETGRLKKLKKQENGAAKIAGAAVDAAEGAAAPADEEVEECFAILRRMKEAVRHFDGRGKEWREALERSEIVVSDGGDGGREEAENGEEEREKRGWDLNVAAAPEGGEFLGSN